MTPLELRDVYVPVSHVEITHRTAWYGRGWEPLLVSAHPDIVPHVLTERPNDDAWPVGASCGSSSQGKLAFCFVTPEKTMLGFAVLSWMPTIRP